MVPGVQITKPKDYFEMMPELFDPTELGVFVLGWRRCDPRDGNLLSSCPSLTKLPITADTSGKDVLAK